MTSSLFGFNPPAERKRRGLPEEVDEAFRPTSLLLKLYELILKQMKPGTPIKKWRFEIYRDDMGHIESMEAFADEEQEKEKKEE